MGFYLSGRSSAFGLGAHTLEQQSRSRQSTQRHRWCIPPATNRESSVMILSALSAHHRASTRFLMISCPGQLCSVKVKPWVRGQQPQPWGRQQRRPSGERGPWAACSRGPIQASPSPHPRPAGPRLLVRLVCFVGGGRGEEEG